MRYYLALLGLLLGAPALAQPTCPVGTPTGAIQCLPQATAPLSTDVVSGVQQTGPTRSNQTVKVSLSQIVNSGFVGSFSTLGASGAASLLGGGTFTGTFAGNPTFSGVPVLDAGATLQGAITSSGGSVSGSFGGNPTWTGTHTFNGASVTGSAPFSVPVDASTAIPTTGTTSQTIADAFGQNINAAAFGVKCDGSTDDKAALQAAVTATTAVGKRLLLGPTASTCNISGHINLAAGAKLLGIGNPTIRLTNGLDAQAFSLTGANIELGAISIDGNNGIMSSTSAFIILTQVTYSYLHDIYASNVAQGMTLSGSAGVGSSYNNFRNFVILNSLHNAVLIGSGSYYNVFEDFTLNGQVAGGVFMATPSGRNRFVNFTTNNSGLELFLNNYGSDHNEIVNPQITQEVMTAWATGITVTSGQKASNANNVYTAGSGGVTGATPPTCTVGTCSDGTITWTYIRPYESTGDNCISLAGSYNTVTGGHGEACAHAGIAFYGEHNTANGYRALNVGQTNNHGGSIGYACFDFFPNYGGLGRSNSISGVVCEDDQTVPTVWYPIHLQFGYSLWHTATLYNVAGQLYLYYGSNIYLKQNAACTSGATPPTWTSGTSSDGGCDWTFVRAFTGPTGASNNSVGSISSGASVSGVLVTDDTDNLYNSLFSSPAGIFFSRGGGCTLGANAVDLQTNAVSGANCASGDHSVIVGGINNKAAAANSVVGGTNVFANSTATNSVGFGGSITMNGINEIAAGASHVLSGSNTSAFGSSAADRGRFGGLYTANGTFSAAGDAQSLSGLVLRASVSDASQVRLTANGAVASSTNCLNLATDNTSIAFTVRLHARDITTAGNDFDWYLNRAAIYRDTGVASTVIDATGTPVSGSRGSGSTASVSVFAADTTNGCLNLAWTPPAANTDTWDIVARIDAVEVK